MLNYIIRRLAYAIPILIGVNFLIFLLFFVVNDIDDVARLHLGGKRAAPQEAIDQWKAARGYDLPLFLNADAEASDRVTKTIFFEKSLRLFAFDFGKSDAGRNIGDEIRQRMWPSLAIAIPTFIVGLAVNITLALLLALFRATRFDVFGVGVLVLLMSVSGLFYIIGGQAMFSNILKWTPVSGYSDDIYGVRFVVLPFLIGVISGIGSGTRFYRTVFLEEMERDYVTAARAKGLTEMQVLFGHVLRNGMIPILTGIVAVIPLLFMGSLLLESFFSIPGLGSYTIDAIQQQDFAIVRAMVFLGSVLYIVGLAMTDISYSLVDPRVRF